MCFSCLFYLFAVAPLPLPPNCNPPPPILPIVYNFTLPTSRPSNLPNPPIPPTLTAQKNNKDQNQKQNKKKEKKRKKRHNPILILIPKNPPIRRWNIRITPKLHQIIIRRTPRNLRNQTIRIRHRQSIRKPTHRLTMHDSNRHILSGGKLSRNGQ